MPGEETSADFTIIVPLFGHPRYFDRRAELLRYQPNVLVALEVGTPLMADFAEQLESEGWRSTGSRWRARTRRPS